MRRYLFHSLGKTGITYYGINCPTVIINAPAVINLSDLDITLHHVQTERKCLHHAEKRSPLKGKHCPPHLTEQLESILEEITELIDDFYDENGEALFDADLDIDSELDELSVEDYEIDASIFDSVMEAKEHYGTELYYACNDIENSYEKVADKAIKQYEDFFYDLEDMLSAFVDEFSEKLDEILEEVEDEELQEYLLSKSYERKLWTHPIFQRMDLCEAFDDMASIIMPYDLPLKSESYLPLCDIEYDREDGCSCDIDDAIDKINEDAQDFTDHVFEKLNQQSNIFFDKTMNTFKETLLDYVDQKLF